MGTIYEVRRCGAHRWYDVHTKIHDDLFRHSRIIMVITSTLGEATMLVLLIQIFMNIGSGVEKLLRMGVHTDTQTAR
jgi:hypothetical protein